MPVDKHDVGIGWTVQDGAALPSEESLPGQVFHVSQLPDRERQARELGPEYPELWDNVNGFPGGNLVAFDSKEEAELHPSGPEPHELEKGEIRQKIVDKAEEDKASREEAQAKELEDRRAEREGEPQPEVANSGAPVEGETAADSGEEVTEPAAGV